MMCFLPKSILGARSLTARAGVIGNTLLSLFLTQPTTLLAETEITKGVVLERAKIVDTRNGSLSSPMDLVLKNGTIDRIEPADTLSVGDQVKVINATGKYVVPGYLDMHAHVLDSDRPDAYLDVMLAHGITGFRQMSGSPDLLRKQRAQTDLTAAQQPDVLAMPGTILVDAVTPTPNAVTKKIHRQKKQGADFIKATHLRPASFFRALQTSNKAGLPIAGHVLPTVDAVKAARQGLNAIEHLGGKESLLIGCSRAEQSLRERIAAAPKKGPPEMPPKAMARFIERMIANPVIFRKPSEFGAIETVVTTFDREACLKQAKVFAKNETWQVPTLIRLRTMQFGDAKRYRTADGLQYVSNDDRALWEELAERFRKTISTKQRQLLETLFQRQLELVSVLEEADVPLLAGSDIGGQWVLPGISLHQEFNLLAQAGLKPLQILQMTTINGARFLNKEDTMGTVEVGKQADLVLLDKNPLSDAENLHRIHAVVKSGTVLTHTDIETLKATHQ